MQETISVTLAGLVLNLALSALKVWLGLLGSSYAVVADGVHSLSDCATDVAILVGVRFWSKPPDEGHPHGHRRIETLVTISIGFSLTAVAIGIGYKAMVSIWTAPDISPGWIAAFAAAVSIVTKEALFRWTNAVGTRIKSQAVIANAWHHRSDAFSSVPALLAVVIAILQPQLRYMDLVGGVIVALFILHSAIQIARPAFMELIDSGASLIVRRKLHSLASKVPGVKDVHGLRTRFMGSGLLVDLHVMVDPAMSVRESHGIAHQVEGELVEQGPGVIDVLVHIEPFGEET